MNCFPQTLPLREKCPYSTFFGPYFAAFELNTDQKNFEYGHFSCSVHHRSLLEQSLNTAQKMKFSIKDFFSKCDEERRNPTEEILNEKLHFLCSVNMLHFSTYSVVSLEMNTSDIWSTDLPFTCSTSTIETLEESLKYVQI